MDSETLKAIQIIALDSVENPSYHAFIRKTQRWYSREFATPLSEVESIPDEQLLAVYYEDFLTELYDPDDAKAAEQYARIRDQILKTQKDAVEEASDDDAWVKQMNEEVNRDKQPNVPIPASDVPIPEPDVPIGVPIADQEMPNIEDRAITTEDSYEPEDG